MENTEQQTQVTEPAAVEPVVYTPEQVAQIIAERDNHAKQAQEWQGQAEQYYNAAQHYQNAFEQAKAAGATTAQATAHAETTTGVHQSDDGGFVDKTDLNSFRQSLINDVKQTFKGELTELQQQQQQHLQQTQYLAKVEEAGQKYLEQYDFWDTSVPREQMEAEVHSSVQEAVRQGANPKSAYDAVLKGRVRVRINNSTQQPQVKTLPGQSGYSGITTAQPAGLESQIAQAKEAKDKAESLQRSEPSATNEMNAFKAINNYYGLMKKKETLANQVKL